MQNIEYILETGAGWAGPIERGYVIVKFPYAATRENVLSESTTPGYQFLYNEIFWSFGDLEPTDENNINVSIVSPFTWEKILFLRRSLKENPELPEDWISLAQIYNDISTWHGSNLRNSEYRQKVSSAYEQAIQGNPDSADIFANYAQFVFEDCCFYTTEQLPASKSKILTLLNRALALDSKNEIALRLIDSLRSIDPGFEYTSPPTIPPTPTSLYTATPSATPTIAPTYLSSPQPIIVTSIVTVIHTKIVEAPTSTPAPSLSLVSSPTQTESPVEEKPNTPTFIFGGLVIFVAGIGAGVYFSKRIMK
jgi:hypothetical protein